MNESRLDQDLKALSKRARPNLPADFNARVWSKVQSRETTARARRENWLIENAELRSEEALWQENPDRITALKFYFTHFL